MTASAVQPASASVSPAGSWSGMLEAGGKRLRLVVHLREEPEGWRATLDSPDQGMRGLPVDSVALSPAGISLASRTLQFRFSGGFVGPDCLTGIFEQGPLRTALVLRRGGPERPPRPQEPQPPFPYRSEELSFVGRDGAVTLHGTLTLPEEEGPFPALVLVTGSGTQNRDEELFDHKPFLVLADYLTRHGIAVFRYDDRGYGATAEEALRLRGSTTSDLAEDALGAFDRLRAHPAVDRSRIGIGGHSEGGTIAFMAAAREPQVAFVVSLAGSLLRGDRVLVQQSRTALGGGEVAEAYCRALERLYAAWFTHTPEELAAQRDRIVAEALAGESLPEPLRANLVRVADAAQNPWIYYFVRCDPAEAVAALGDRPCLALNGTKDRQVDAEQHLGRLRTLTAGAANVRILPCEGLNHLFQPCRSGDPSEYAQIETTIAPEVLAELAAWLSQFAETK